MSKIEWFNVAEHGQEISERMGFRGDEETGENVCCKEVYNIVWEALKKCSQKWNQIYRAPHYHEFDTAWEEREAEKPFRTMRNWWEIFREAKVEISKFYNKHLGRSPTPAEIRGAYRNAFVDPDFRFNYEVPYHGDDGKTTKEYLFENYEKRKRPDDADVVLTEMVEAGKCCVCGEPVYVYDPKIYKDAGEIEISFGYGSGRDMDWGKGLIHDLCSAKLDQEIFKQRLNWGGPCSDGDSTIDIKKSEETGELHYEPRERRNDRLKDLLD